MTSKTRYALLALAILATAGGIYGFRGHESKIEAEAPGGGLKPYATGALAAFLVKPERLPVPDIAFQDGAGAPLHIGQWHGRVVLLNLWATWCAPCRKEMPTLAALQKRLGSKDFEVVAISIDRKGVAASAAFLKETGADGLGLYVEPSAKILDELQALGLPATVLIDREGKEVGRLLGPAEWSSPEAIALIKAVLAEKTPD